MFKQTPNEGEKAPLPSSEKKEKAIDLGYRMLKGKHKKVVSKGTVSKSNVTIMYYGDASYSPRSFCTGWNAYVGKIITC